MCRSGHWYDLGCTGSVYYVCETATGIDPCEKGVVGKSFIGVKTEIWIF